MQDFGSQIYAPLDLTWELLPRVWALIESGASLAFVKMGTFSVDAAVSRVGDPTHSTRIALVADTGATYTALPLSILRGLGVEAVRKDRLRLADGSIIERSLGEVAINLGEGRSVSATPVVFGSEGVSLLGSVTIEELGLAVDPTNKRLVPAEGLLLSDQEV